MMKITQEVEKLVLGQIDWEQSVEDPQEMLEALVRYGSAYRSAVQFGGKLLRVLPTEGQVIGGPTDADLRQPWREGGE